MLLPADLLVSMPPWKQPATPFPFWNALLWDSMGQYFPWREFAARALRSGVIPLWNPFQFCGTPFLANGQSALFYPFNLIFWLFDVRRAFALSAFLHLALGGWFSYLFLRGLRLGRFGATVGAVAFALNGYFITWIYLPTIVNSAIWLPLALLLAEKFLRRGRALFAVGAGGAIGLSALAGHPQIFLLCTVFFVVYFLARGLSRGEGHAAGDGTPALQMQLHGGGQFDCAHCKRHPRPTNQGTEPAGGPSAPLGAGRASALQLIARYIFFRRWLRLAGGLLLAGTFALLAAAVQLLPLAELLRYSHRGAQEYRFYLSWAMPWQNLTTLLLPDFFGSPAQASYWGKGNYAEFCAYAGIVPLGLAILGAIYRRDFCARFFAVSAAVALLCVLGTPLNWPLYHFVPGLNRAGSPARLLLFYLTSVAFLAGLGADWLAQACERKSPATGRHLSRGASNSRSDEGKARARKAAPAADDPFGWLRPRLLALILGLALFAVISALLAKASIPFLPEFTLAEAFEDARPNLALLAAISLISVILILALRGFPGRGRNALAAAVVLLIVADLLIFGFRYLRFRPRGEVFPSTQAIRFLQEKQGEGRFLALSPGPLKKAWPASDLPMIFYPLRGVRPFPKAILPPNSATVYSLRDVLGYDSLYLEEYRSLVGKLEEQDPSPPANGNLLLADKARPDMLGIFGIRYLVSLLALQGQNLRLAYDGEVKVYEVLSPSARARITNESFAPAAAGKAEIAENGINHIRVKATLSSPGHLVVADAFYPGWHAVVDGGEAEITRVEGAFRAVALPAGNHQVDFYYQPASFKIGLFAFLLAISLSSACAAAKIAAGGKES